MTEAVTTSRAGSPADIEDLAAASGGNFAPGSDSTGYGAQISWATEESLLRSGVTPIVEYGLLRVHGADAASFLQAQLTSDVTALKGGEAGLSGYCSVKGRLTASFWIWRDENEDAFWLACSRDIATAIARRLSMFVLRAKAKVEDMSSTMALVGSLSLDGDPLAAKFQGPVRLPFVDLDIETLRALLPSEAGAVAATATQPVRIERTLRPVPVSDLPGALVELRDEGARLLPTVAWRRLEVLSGIARINAGNQELFVPQMVNFELVGGVNFKKGCYPGQEVVARSQYLGKLKRRMFMAVGDGVVPASGSDVFVQKPAATQAADSAGGSAQPPTRGAEPVGQVVLAAPLAPEGRFVVLFESRIAAVSAQDMIPVDSSARDSAGLKVGESSLRLLPLPYPIPSKDKLDAR